MNISVLRGPQSFPVEAYGCITLTACMILKSNQIHLIKIHFIPDEFSSWVECITNKQMMRKTETIL